jgi:hypothetical protein
VLILALLCALPAGAAMPTPRAFNLFFTAGKNPSNFHGSSAFRVLTFEVMFDDPRISRWKYLHDTQGGLAVSYAQIHQPRSWFGHHYADPDDAVRGQSLFVFLRRQWRPGANIRPFVDLGTGPMWANRRVPAATSRLNANSQAALGVTLFANSRWPVIAGYRFSHISNGGFTGRNPGLDVHSFFMGTTLKQWR